MDQVADAPTSGMTPNTSTQTPVLGRLSRLGNEELLDGAYLQRSSARVQDHLGLARRFGPSGRIYDLEEAIRAAHRWMRERDARADPFLSGMFTRGEVVYAGSEAEAAHNREPVAIFTGEVLPHYAADNGDDAVRILLNELASEIAYLDLR